jgi:hypothetical protein
MQKVFEPRPKSVVREIQEYLAKNNGHWTCLSHLPKATKSPRPRRPNRPR